MKSVIGKSIFDLDTPALIVDIDVLERNIARQQRAADAAGLQMRPHIKAHKTPEIAHMQLAAGAVGVTAAKISEAEVFATAGVRDIFIANELVGPQKLARLVALSRRVDRLSVAVDSMDVAQPLSDAFAAAGLAIDVLIEMDNGAGRCGVTEDGLLPLAERVAELPALRLVGVMAYCPHAYKVRGREEQAKVAAWEGRWLAAQADRLRAAGFDVQRVSGGSTPTAPHYQPGCGLTEIRPGTYCLNDQDQVTLGTCTRDDVAASILATVISRPGPERAILDAGAKAIGLGASPLSDGYGFHRHGPERLYKINDEHGYLDVSESPAPPKVGDKLAIIPPRICTCINYHDWLYIVRDGRVEDVWRIAARGTIR